MNYPQWAYVTLKGSSSWRAFGYTMLYLALRGAYNNGDLDFVADLTTHIKKKIDPQDILDTPIKNLKFKESTHE